MDRAKMRERYRKLLGGLADNDTDQSVNEALNDAYQYGLPSAVGGPLSEGTWTLTTVASQESYPIPAYVIAPREGITVDDYKVQYFARSDEFWTRYRRGDTGEGIPRAALFYGSTVTLRPVPSAVFSIHIPARMGPATQLEQDTDAIDDFNHAMAVVCLAAQEFVADEDLEELHEKLSARFELYKSRLSLKVTGRSRGPAFERIR